jgi:transglutaminase-like putative cysteine protease
MRTPAQQAKPLPDSLGLKPKPEPAQIVAAPPVAGLPRSHLIGSGPELSRETVMIISTGDIPPMPQSIGGMYQAPLRYYWRNGVYDRYLGTGWATSETQSSNIPAGHPVISNTGQAVRQVRQEVQAKANLEGLVYQAGLLVAADRDLRVYFRTNKDVFSSAFSRVSDIYIADSLVSIASVEQLQTVKSEYPDWISTRYLQLPDSTPQRVLALARDLTATAPTPYDRAAAIESYLRTYSYTLDLPSPPLNRDVADYFLFDLKRGYCDYFATAMVVLARASGLPARMVVGYAAGTYDPMNAEYIVSQADAHSWPEIYFDQYGWIEIEPTSGRASIVRATALQAGTGLLRSEAPLQPRVTLLDELDWLIPLFVAALVIFFVPGWLLIDDWRLARKQPREVLNLLYGRLYTQGRKLSVRNNPGDTALEYSSALLLCVSSLAPTKAREVVTRTTASDLNHLTELYLRSAYSPHAPDTVDRQIALQTYQRIRLRLSQAWIWRLRASLWQRRRL